MAEIAIEKDVVYGDAGNRPLKCDVYRPAENTQKAAVLIVHGGGWVRGEKGMVGAHAKHLARDGFVVVACEYRLTPEAHYPAQIHDVKRAIRWLRSKAGEFGFDADKLCLQGHSAGAHLVLLSAGTPSDERLDPPDANRKLGADCAAVVAVYPPVLFFREARVSGGTPASALKGCDVDDETAALASPISHVSADFPPTMLLHGDADKVVPVSASRRFEEALRAKGGKVDMLILAGQPHGFFNHPKMQPAMMTLVSAFFQRNVSRVAEFAPIAAPATASRAP